MNIRAARPEDAPAIAEVIRASYSRLPTEHVPFDMPLYHAAHHREGMEDLATRWAVLCEQGRHRGVAMWRMLPGLAHLHLLFVDGERQGQGYGMRLLKHYQQEALREQPDTRLYTLHCLRNSAWALRFYRHHGFTVYEPGDEGRHPDLVLWLDAGRRHDADWPLKGDKALLYKLVKG